MPFRHRFKNTKLIKRLIRTYEGFMESLAQSEQGQQECYRLNVTTEMQP
jgi:hypothetical protein